MPHAHAPMPNAAAQFRWAPHHRKHASRVREIDVKLGFVTFADGAMMSIDRWMRS